MVKKDTTWYIFGTVIDDTSDYVVADVESVDDEGNIYFVDGNGIEHEVTAGEWKRLVSDEYIIPASNVDKSSWEVAALLKVFNNGNIREEGPLMDAARALFRYAGRE